MLSQLVYKRVLEDQPLANNFVGMSNPHVLAVPYPAQGHVIPLMELCFCLTKHGCKVTFVNTDYNHKRVVNALAETNQIDEQIRLVSIPDGLEPWEDRNDIGNLTETFCRVMPGKLEELIQDINKQESDKVSCIISDGSMGWVFEVAEKMKIRRASFWPASAALFALNFYVPKLIDDGVVKKDGSILKDQMIEMFPNSPRMNSKDLAWTCFKDQKTRTIIFELMTKISQCAKKAEWLLCNSVHNLEHGVFDFSPKFVPIGPLLASSRLGSSAGYFWPEDSTCLNWLSNQPPKSVIYVAFGSFTVFNRTQFQELALGLELTGQPFLWVVRPDITKDSKDAYPEGIFERIGSRGQMVGWAPQQRVLSHPSIACFISHCGWNSTLEGVSNGVPFLTWPYFADQFLNESYICDIWKNGLKLNADENGLINREEIKSKVEQIVGDGKFKARALQLKDLAMGSVREGGESIQNFKNFIKWLKE